MYVEISVYGFRPERDSTGETTNKKKKKKTFVIKILLLFPKEKKVGRPGLAGPIHTRGRTPLPEYDDDDAIPDCPNSSAAR